MKAGKRTALLLAGALAIQSPLTVLAEEGYPAEQQETTVSEDENASGESSDTGTPTDNPAQLPEISEENGDNTSGENTAGALDEETVIPDSDQSGIDAAEQTDDGETVTNEPENTVNSEEPDTELPEEEEPGEVPPEVEEPDVHEPGWNLADEGWYYYDGNGNKVTGWLSAGGAWYYLDPANAEYPGLMVSDCSRVINGTTYSFYSSGTMAAGGWYHADEGWYYHSGSGGAVTGWLALGGTWYYLDPYNTEHPGLMLENCGREINGLYYNFSSGGAMAAGGWYQADEGWYYLDGSGARMTGWQAIGGAWYYLDGANAEYPGLMAENCGREIDGQYYHFRSNGAMALGWYYADEGWYYHNGSGVLMTGWQAVGGVWYYLDGANAEYPGLMISDGIYEINGQKYQFGPSGAMAVGWYYTDEGWRYYSGSGAMASGWAFAGGSWYYLDPENDNVMVHSCEREIDGKIYRFEADGSMYTGWYLENGTEWRYYRSSGESAVGWVMDGSKWYYFDPENENRMLSDCEKIIDGIRYIFTSSGAMYTGWYYVEGEGYYYYTAGGFQASGWYQDGATWYYLDPENNNIMVNDTWKVINGNWYSFFDWGGMRTNWSYITGNWYYFGGDGAMKTGWQTIGNSRYYFYKENDPNGGVWGAMATNVTIDGIYIAADGTASAAYGYAAAVLDQIGWDLRAAFNWSAGLSYVSVSDTPDPGSEYFATYGFQNGSGDCYVMAATFYYMAKLLGYDAHQMTGYVPLLNGGMGPHSWVEIDMNGTTYVFDPDFTHETGYNGYQITYGASGTWIYRDYYRMN